MKNKRLIVLAVALAACVAVLLGVYFATRPDTAAGTKTFTVTVVHADGTSKDFSYTTGEEYLGPVLLAEGLIQGEEGPYGLMVSTVDGEEASWEANSAYWALYEGENFANQGIDLTPVTDGGSYKLEYTVG